MGSAHLSGGGWDLLDLGPVVLPRLKQPDQPETHLPHNAQRTTLQPTTQNAKAFQLEAGRRARCRGCSAAAPTAYHEAGRRASGWCRRRCGTSPPRKLHPNMSGETRCTMSGNHVRQPCQATMCRARRGSEKAVKRQ